MSDTPQQNDTAPVQPLADGDTSIASGPERDAAQIEWDRTTLADAGEEVDIATATGDDPAEVPVDADEIPRDDLPTAEAQPDTQGDDPVTAALGEEGQGDIAPEDL